MNLKNDETSIFDQDASQIDKDLETSLSSDEKMKLLKILSQFRQISRCSPKDYLRFIANILNFFEDFIQRDNITFYAITGIIPSYYHVVEFKKSKGIVVGLDSRQIEKVLQKTKLSFSKTFLKHYASEISPPDLEHIFEKNIHIAKKMISRSKLISNFKKNIVFYFIELANFANNGINFQNEKNSFSNQPLKSNAIFLRDFQLKKSNEKLKLEEEKQSKKWRGLTEQLEELNEKCHSLISENQLPLDLANEKYMHISNSDDDDEIYDKAKFQLHSIDDTISHIKFKEENPLLMHKKGQPWPDENILKFGFLIKYCSAAAYRRLYILLNEKIPPPATIESHFMKDLNERKIVLTDPFKLNEILDQYWLDNKEKAEKYINDFNNEYNTNEEIDDFKINLCVGCDAASFTSFGLRNKKYKTKKSKKKKDKSESEDDESKDHENEHENNEEEEEEEYDSIKKKVKKKSKISNIF